MSQITSPAQSRTPIGYVMVAGKRLEVTLNDEWARYFEALAIRSTSASTQIRNLQSAVDMSSVMGSGDSDVGFDAMPGIPGRDGATGATGPALGFLMADPEMPDFLPGLPGLPGTPGVTGGRGDAGPTLFLLQDNDTPGDTFMIGPPSTPEGFIAPVLTNSWGNYGGPGAVAGYYKDPFGVVHLRGLVSLGATGPIFTLPVGYRPSATAIFSVVSNNTIGRVDVLATGDVSLAIGNNNFVSLEGITFRAA